MTVALEDIPAFPPLDNTPNARYWSCGVPIGASGATGTLTNQPQGIAVAKNGTGTYDVTGMPPAPAGSGFWTFGLYSPTPTVGCAVVTAYDLNAGTMTFKTLSGVTATEPASGNIIYIYFAGQAR